MLRLRIFFLWFAIAGTAGPGLAQNDKQVIGDPVLTPQEISDGAVIIYLIRFQNTGEDTARQVVIRDTLDPRLDPATFINLESSHPFQLLGEGGSEIRWYFEDIYLPDSASGGTASRGFVLFSVKPREFLAPGQSILNRACISFDESLTVCTNYAVVMIDDDAGAEDVNDKSDDFHVAPNPNNGQFGITASGDGEMAGNTQCWITDMNGKIVWNDPSENMIAAGRQIVLESPSPGLYLLWMKSGKRVQIERFSVVR